jgi:hypothetical protein
VLSSQAAIGRKILWISTLLLYISIIVINQFWSGVPCSSTWKFVSLSFSYRACSAGHKVMLFVVSNKTNICLAFPNEIYEIHGNAIKSIRLTRWCSGSYYEGTEKYDDWLYDGFDCLTSIRFFFNETLSLLNVVFNLL